MPQQQQAPARTLSRARSQLPQPDSYGLIRQVFISHTGKDEGAKTFAASILKPALEAAGLKVFIDYRDLQLGDPWPERLVEAACRSAVMVVVLSKSYTDRFWCCLELDLAMHGSSQYPRSKDPRIIPVFYDDPYDPKAPDNPDSLAPGETIRQQWAALLAANLSQQEQQPETDQEQPQPQWVQQQQQQQHKRVWQLLLRPWRLLSPLRLLLSPLRLLRLSKHKQQQQQQQRKLLPEDRVPFVHPERWAQNISDMQERKQNVRRSAVAAGAKDKEWQLAMRVVVAAAPGVYVPAFVEEDWVGYEKQLAGLFAEVLPRQLEGVTAEPERAGVWIHGLGGSGKTVMAKLLFNQLAPGFARRALIELNPEDGTQKAQEHLVKALKALGAWNVSEHMSAAELLSVLQEFVQDKAVLLAIDNVWTAQQLDALLPPRLADGSRIIITSRFASLDNSKRYKKLSGHLYHHELGLLDSDAARDLLRFWTQLTDPLPVGLRDLEEAVIKACGGLPLALEVLGAQLANKTDLQTWKDALDLVMKAKPPPNANTSAALHGILVTSFNCLTAAPQNMFLDVVSVLHGQDSRRALRIWQSWWGSAEDHLAELQKLALVKVEQGKLRVHDVIRSFGRGIILGEVEVKPAGGAASFVGSRMWVEDDNMPSRVSQDATLVAISTAAHLDTDWGVIAQYDPKQLRILIAPRVTKLTNPGEFLSRATVLQWLDLNSCQELSHLPESVGQMTALQVLDLSYCGNLTALPESVGQMTALQVLELGFCGRLGTLPESVEKLTALQELNLTECVSFCHLPDSVGQMIALEHLDLTFCKQLYCLPDSLGQLPALRYLGACMCEQLYTLPPTMRDMTALQVLDLYGCDFDTLPESVCQLKALQRLAISRISSIPESVGQLTALTRLELSECSFHSLPEAMGKLAALQELKLDDAKQLTSLPESLGQLTALRVLDLRGCEDLTSWPDSLKHLTGLQIKYGSW